MKRRHNGGPFFMLVIMLFPAKGLNLIFAVQGTENNVYSPRTERYVPLPTEINIFREGLQLIFSAQGLKIIFPVSGKIMFHGQGLTFVFPVQELKVMFYSQGLTFLFPA